MKWYAMLMYGSWPWPFKVAGHRFCMHIYWCNSARTQGLQKTNILFTQHLHYLLFFFEMERSVLMALVFYYKDM